jgi:hypothetical protein
VRSNECVRVWVCLRERARESPSVHIQLLLHFFLGGFRKREISNLYSAHPGYEERDMDEKLLLPISWLCHQIWLPCLTQNKKGVSCRCVCVCVLKRWGAAEKQSEKRQSKFLTKSNRRFLRLVLKRNPPTSSSSFSPTRDLARKRFQMNKKRTSQNNDDWVKESSLFRRAGEGGRGSFWRGERVERMKES